jgi:glycosyltransferase involved in cell wall biosynthesis
VSEPFFSIAIPTKNRSDRVGNAIKSVLGQTFTDVEVVVCDNSDHGA